MQLNNIIFHALKTNQYESEVEVIERDCEFSLSDPLATRLVTEARKGYNKDSGIAYATFGHGWLPDRLTQLLNSEINFLELSQYGVNDLKAKLQREPLTTGGHLFFIRYTEEPEEFLMTLLLKDIEGLIVKEDLSITESHILNLDKLHFAARININKWLNGDSGYISFLKGSRRQGITEYFKEFLCIDESSFNDPKKNTEALVSAIKDYCSKKFPEEKQLEVRSRVAKEIQQKINDDDYITIGAIAALIDPDNSEEFINFLNESDYQVQPVFKADKTKLKKLTRFTGKIGNILTISFESEAFDKNMIEFQDQDENNDMPKLIIKDIPENLLKELRGLGLHDNTN